MFKQLSLSVLGFFVVASLVVVVGSAQSDPRGKSHTLHGTVEGIYDSSQSIRVRQEKIEGYSSARIATYHVDDAAILKKLQPDDRIVATIYEKDNALYDIRVVTIGDKVRPPK